MESDVIKSILLLSGRRDYRRSSTDTFDVLRFDCNASPNRHAGSHIFSHPHMINGWTKVCPEFELLKPDKARLPDKLLSTH